MAASPGLRSAPCYSPKEGATPLQRCGGIHTGLGGAALSSPKKPPRLHMGLVTQCPKGDLGKGCVHQRRWGRWRHHAEPGASIVLSLPHTEPHAHLAMATLEHFVPSVPRDSPDGPELPAQPWGHPLESFRTHSTSQGRRRTCSDARS